MSATVAMEPARCRLRLRPALDPRPPALEWSGPLTATIEVPPDQLPLLLVETPPTPGRIDSAGPPGTACPPVRVDPVPAGFEALARPEAYEEARTAVRWFAQLLTEATDGRRPLDALGCWLDEWVLAEVSRRVRLQRARRPRTPTAAPPPSVVSSLRAQLTTPTTLEVAVHLRRGRRSSAMAFRLDRADRRWRCTALEL